MNAQEREAFWKTLCALPGLDLSQDAKQLMAAIRFPKLLFRYRPVNLNSLEALRTNRLYFSSANYYDDPFDTFLHIDIDSAEMDKNIVSNYHLRGDLADVLPILTREIEQLDHSEWRKEI